MVEARYPTAKAPSSSGQVWLILRLAVFLPPVAGIGVPTIYSWPHGKDPGHAKELIPLEAVYGTRNSYLLELEANVSSDHLVDRDDVLLRNGTADSGTVAHLVARNGTLGTNTRALQCNLFKRYLTWNYSLSVGASIAVWIVLFLALLSFCCCCFVTKR
mmetsp:Transcript_8301/g.18947  ORF Transcript_8301/g.18947 Transcript_8301/m.18947 type:complete len:159 (-) Transcript_8301:88-564(-)